MSSIGQGRMDGMCVENRYVLHSNFDQEQELCHKSIFSLNCRFASSFSFSSVLPFII